ncbi:MAG: hypothetical protein DMG73_04645 [Acidobacteria bacterium]|nr:MAG: hypothetical protein DMG73_04645 [Acidobacteriota bacterium]PYX62466.1 MAG: hypothetical protein DMG74_20730 [Acidobacteriota bacterium]
MTTLHRSSESLRSIAGGTLVGLGLHILFGNLDRAAAPLRHILGTTAGEALGVLPSVVLAASQAVQAYGFHHQSFLQDVLRILVPFWPLLLVIVGMILLRDVFTDQVKSLPTPTKYFQNKDTGCRFCCPSFDV